MGIESKKLIPEEMAKMQEERVLSDAELIKDGAEITSDGKIFATEKQQKEAKEEFEKKLKEIHIINQGKEKKDPIENKEFNSEALVLSAEKWENFLDNITSNEAISARNKAKKIEQKGNMKITPGFRLPWDKKNSIGQNLFSQSLRNEDFQKIENYKKELIQLKEKLKEEIKDFESKHKETKEKKINYENIYNPVMKLDKEKDSLILFDVILLTFNDEMELIINNAKKILKENNVSLKVCHTVHGGTRLAQTNDGGIYEIKQSDHEASRDLSAYEILQQKLEISRNSNIKGLSVSEITVKDEIKAFEASGPLFLKLTKIKKILKARHYFAESAKNESKIPVEAYEFLNKNSDIKIRELINEILNNECLIYFDNKSHNNLGYQAARTLTEHDLDMNLTIRTLCDMYQRYAHFTLVNPDNTRNKTSNSRKFFAQIEEELNNINIIRKRIQRKRDDISDIIYKSKSPLHFDW